MVIAFVDESQPGGTAAGRHYVLAATIPSEEADLDLYRTRLRDSKPAHLSKPHWHDAGTRHRAEQLEMIADFDLFAWAVVTSPVLDEPPERSRRRCFERLVYELHRLELDGAVFESRSAGQDQLDLRMLDSMRSRKVVPGRFRVWHRAGPVEPMLWVSDAVAGAVSDDLQGRPQGLAALRALTWISAEE